MKVKKKSKKAQAAYNAAVMAKKQAKIASKSQSSLQVMTPKTLKATSNVKAPKALKVACQDVKSMPNLKVKKAKEMFS